MHPWIFFFFVSSHSVSLVSLQYSKQKSSRFLQKGFFDAFDREDEKIFDTTFHGYCSSFSPPYTNKKIKQDWIQQSNDWSYENDNTLVYSGRGESKVYPFWLWFWKYPRFCLTPALIKNNYFCQNSQITAQVQLNGASEAGIVFRARGTFDFWSLMLTRSSVVLVWFYQGERKEIKKCPYTKSDWTLLHIAEEIGSVTVFCGDNVVRHNVTHTLQDINEIADEHMGAAGLVSYGGKARFRDVVLGEVNWTPDIIQNTKRNRQKKKIINSEEQVVQSLEDEDISSSLSDLLSWCPNPSLCGDPPYRIRRRPQTAV